jgi:hypothetical protein
MYEYGCVRCQKYHREDEAIYAEHIMCQSKHGPRLVDVEEAVLRAAGQPAGPNALAAVKDTRP